MTEPIAELAIDLKLDPQAAYTIKTCAAKDVRKDYLPLIFSRWLRSLRFGAPWFKHINSDDFYKNYHAHIEMLLNKPGTLIRMALLPETATGPETILGFSVSREDVLDYIHVHKDARKRGIGKHLLPSVLTTFTHITNDSLHIWQENPKYRHLKFNPFA